MAGKILIVDDDLSVRVALHGVLEAYGYDAHEAGNSSEALNLISDETFDAAVMDLDLPGMDGIELLAALKRRRPDLKIIATWGDGPKDLRRAIARTADVVLEKPYDPKDLVAVLRRETPLPTG